VAPPRGDAVASREIIEAVPKLMEMIFCKLNGKDLGRAGAACRRWRTEARLDAPWETVCKQSYPLAVKLQGLSGRPWREVYAQQCLALSPPRKVLDYANYLLGVEIRDRTATKGTAPLISVLKEIPVVLAGTGSRDSSLLLKHKISEPVPLGDFLDEDSHLKFLGHHIGSHPWVTSNRQVPDPSGEMDHDILDYFRVADLFDIRVALIRVSDQKVLHLGSSVENAADLPVDVERDMHRQLVWSIPGMEDTHIQAILHVYVARPTEAALGKAVNLKTCKVKIADVQLSLADDDAGGSDNVREVIGWAEGGQDVAMLDRWQCHEFVLTQ
jgi:hypothetical protein